LDAFIVTIRGYWGQRADERLGGPPKVHPGVFIGHRRGWKTPKGAL